MCAWAQGYLHDELKKNGIPQTTNMLGEFMEIYATLYGRKKPVGMDNIDNKINDL